MFWLFLSWCDDIPPGMGWGRDGVVLIAYILESWQHGSCAWLRFLAWEVPCLSKCSCWWIRRPELAWIHPSLSLLSSIWSWSKWEPTKLPVFQLLEVLPWPEQWLSLCLRSAEISFWVSTGKVLLVWLLYACHIVHCKNIPFICLLILLLKLYCQLIFNSYKGWGRVNWNLWSHLLYFLCPCIVFRALFPWPQKKKVNMKVRGKREKKNQPRIYFCSGEGIVHPSSSNTSDLVCGSELFPDAWGGGFLRRQLMVGSSPAVCLG